MNQLKLKTIGAAILVFSLLSILPVTSATYTYSDFDFQVIGMNCILFEFTVYKDGSIFTGTNITVSLWKWNKSTELWEKEMDLSNRTLTTDDTWVYTQGNIEEGQYQLYITYPNTYSQFMHEFNMGPDGFLVYSLSAVIDKPPSTYTGYVNVPILFSVTVTGGYKPYTIAWNFGDSTSGAGFELTHIYTKGGYFSVICTITDALSNQKILYKNIKIIDYTISTTPYSKKGDLSIFIYDEGKEKISVRICGSSNIEHCVLQINPDPQNDWSLSVWGGLCAKNWGTTAFNIDPKTEYVISAYGYQNGVLIAMATTKYKYQEIKDEEEGNALITYIRTTQKKYPEMPEDPIDAWDWLLDEWEKNQRLLTEALTRESNLITQNQELENRLDNLEENIIKLKIQLEIQQQMSQPTESPESPKEEPISINPFFIIILIVIIAIILFLIKKFKTVNIDLFEREDENENQKSKIRLEDEYQNASEENKILILRDIAQRDAQYYIDNYYTTYKHLQRRDSPIIFDIIDQNDEKLFSEYWDTFANFIEKKKGVLITPDETFGK